MILIGQNCQSSKKINVPQRAVYKTLTKYIEKVSGTTDIN